PVHDGAVLPLPDQLFTDVRVVRQSWRVHPQVLGVAPVGVQVRGEHAASGVVRGPEDRDPRAVAEQHGRVPAPGRAVEAAGMHLRAYQQDATVLAGADPRVGDGQAIDEPRALVAHVDGGDVGEAERALEEHAVAGLEVVGRAGAVHDAVELGGLHARLRERLARGLGGETRAGLAVGNPVARLDAAALHYPFV